MATNKPQDEYMKTALRLPADLHAQLHEAAVATGRSYNSEIVTRLQQSFEGVQLATADLQALQGELEQQRSLAQQFQFAADLSDGMRTLMASMLMSTLNRLPREAWPEAMDESITKRVVQWMERDDPRGAVFSILALIDDVDPGVLETLRNFASHLEDHDMVRKPKAITVGKQKKR